MKKSSASPKKKPAAKDIWRSVLHWAVDLVFIIAGSAVYALGVNMFTSPNDIAPGGVTGLSIIISSITPLPVGLLIAVINVPIIVAGFLLLNKKNMIKTLIAVVTVTIMTDYVLSDIPVYLAENGNGILAAIFGGLFMGLGLGLNYMREGTTGGSDVISKIILKYHPQLRLGQAQLITDGVVVAVGLLVYRDLNVVMYALISIFVQSRVVDMLVYGSQECKFMLVFSSRSREIAERLLTEQRGVSLLKGEGAYSKSEQNAVALAVHKSDYVKVRRAIKETDPNAFVIITGASEVLGNGFQKLE